MDDIGNGPDGDAVGDDRAGADSSAGSEAAPSGPGVGDRSEVAPPPPAAAPPPEGAPPAEGATPPVTGAGATDPTVPEGAAAGVEGVAAPSGGAPAPTGEPSGADAGPAREAVAPGAGGGVGPGVASPAVGSTPSPPAPAGAAASPAAPGAGGGHAPPGWWQASDGNWYPPQSSPQPQPQPQAAAPYGLPGAAVPAAPKAKRTWSSGQVVAVAAVAALVALVAGVGIGSMMGGDDEEPAASPAATSAPFTVPESSSEGDDSGDVATDEASPETTEAPASDSGAGTRDDPVPLGEAADTGDGWTVTVVDVNFDAAAAIAAENQFNEPPAPGRQFVMPTLEVTYDGAEAQANTFELGITAVGDSNVEYGGSFDDSCGVTPNGLTDANDLFQGGSVTGTVCWSVESADIDSLVMIVEPSFSFDEDPVFFALR